MVYFAPTFVCKGVINFGFGLKVLKIIKGDTENVRLTFLFVKEAVSFVQADIGLKEVTALMPLVVINMDMQDVITA